MLIDQLTQAITLFGLGMGTVFLLLTILISCVSILSWFCKKVDIAQPSSPQQKSDPTANDIEAVKLAVKSHRNAMGL